MNRKKVFLATPVSGFSSDGAYFEYKKNIQLLVDFLTKEYRVHAAVVLVDNLANYDTPEESVQKDFSEISDSDVFILHHPFKLQTSSLIELGYAYAQNKAIVIIGNKNDLPYLAVGMLNSDRAVFLIESTQIDQYTIEQTHRILDKIAVAK